MSSNIINKMTTLEENCLSEPHFSTKGKSNNINITEIKTDVKNIKKKNRCTFSNCNKKIKITDVKCRCHQIFCAIHRLPESHQCNFDHKNLGKILLEKKLIKVISEKIIKI